MCNCIFTLAIYRQLKANFVQPSCSFFNPVQLKGKENICVI